MLFNSIALIQLYREIKFLDCCEEIESLITQTRLYRNSVMSPSLTNESVAFQGIINKILNYVLTLKTSWENTMGFSQLLTRTFNILEMFILQYISKALVVGKVMELLDRRRWYGACWAPSRLRDISVNAWKLHPFEILLFLTVLRYEEIF